MAVVAAVALTRAPPPACRQDPPHHANHPSYWDQPAPRLALQTGKVGGMACQSASPSPNASAPLPRPVALGPSFFVCQLHILKSCICMEILALIKPAHQRCAGCCKRKLAEGTCLSDPTCMSPQNFCTGGPGPKPPSESWPLVKEHFRRSGACYARELHCGTAFRALCCSLKADACPASENLQARCRAASASPVDPSTTCRQAVHCNWHRTRLACAEKQMVAAESCGVRLCRGNCITEPPVGAHPNGLSEDASCSCARALLVAAAALPASSAAWTRAQLRP